MCSSPQTLNYYLVHKQVTSLKNIGLVISVAAVQKPLTEPNHFLMQSMYTYEMSFVYTAWSGGTQSVQIIIFVSGLIFFPFTMIFP